MSSTGRRRPADSKRILAQLEHGVRPAAKPAHTAGWSIDGWTIGLCALLLLMCCVAWVMHDKTITPKTFRRDYSGTTDRRDAPVLQENASQPERAATIIDVASPAMAKADGEAKAASGARQSGAAPNGGTSSASSAIGATMVDGAAAASSTAGPLMRVPGVQHKPATPAVRAVPPSATAASIAIPAPHASDTDVALLTALVAHSSKSAAVTPERPRDIVERQDGDNTAQLLARCKQLGLIEGMLCRSRICSGRWESDAACRAPSH
ncbi:hypothetical protein GM676_18715 [Duganella radicis]|uniref:Uncharacterized protein n=2 Tax=Duganella radicis TaxID=551988 RepID=A0A6L6PLW2_9BURK|nr:hypothetical protein [Duganella radicis]MTV39597.1 hypothetical protein [Duganella radicis]